jgi:ribonuclease HII
MIRDKSAKKAKGQTAQAPKAAKGVIAVTRPSFRRERVLIKRGIWPVLWWRRR